MLDVIQQALRQSRQALDQLIANPRTLQALAAAGSDLAHCLQNGGRAFACGNGGSMSDAMHFAEELSGRFRGNRRPLAATAISDPGHITCTANDFGYEFIFSRYLEAHGRPGDFLLAISTSGQSPNVVRAAQVAKDLGLRVVALTGKEEALLAEHCHWHIATPASTPYADRVQELHIKCIHILIELCERAIFGEKARQGGS